MRCAVGGEHQPFALSEQRVNRVKQFFLRARFADNELDIIHQQQIETAQPCFKFDHLVLFQGLNKFDHKPLCAAVEDPRARVRLQIGMSNRVEQMGFALSGCRFEVKRGKLRAFGGRHSLSRVACENIRLAQNKGCESERGVEAYAGGETCIPQSVGRDRHHRGIGAVIGCPPAIRVQIEVSHLPAAGVDADVDFAHFTAGNLPRKRQTLGKTVLHPIGREFGWQIQIERAGFLINSAHLDRLDPLAVQLMTKIFAQSAADIGPVGCKVHCL